MPTKQGGTQMEKKYDFRFREYDVDSDEAQMQAVEDCRMYAYAMAALCTNYALGRVGTYANI